MPAPGDCSQGAGAGGAGVAACKGKCEAASTCDFFVFATENTGNCCLRKFAAAQAWGVSGDGMGAWLASGASGGIDNAQASPYGTYYRPAHSRSKAANTHSALTANGGFVRKTPQGRCVADQPSASSDKKLWFWLSLDSALVGCRSNSELGARFCRRCLWSMEGFEGWK